MPKKRKAEQESIEITATKKPKTVTMPKKSRKSKSTSASKPKPPGTAGPAPGVYDTPARPGHNAEYIDLDEYEFYQSGSGANTPAPIHQNLTKLFDHYRDNPTESPDKIGIEGAQRYLTDLNVELDEVAHLGLCDLLQCPSIGEFDREAFINGWRNVSSPGDSYDAISRQSRYVNDLRSNLASDRALFKRTYRNAFKLAKPEGQKSVPLDSALEFWNMFFGESKGGIQWNSKDTKWLDLWCRYYEKVNKRPVNKDLWNMVGELVIKTKEPGGESLEWWKEDGAWPMAIDEFVGQIKDKKKSEGDSMDTS